MKKIFFIPIKILYALIFFVIFLGYKGFIYQDIKSYIMRLLSNNSIGSNIDTFFMIIEIMIMLLIYKKLPSSIKNGYGIRKINIKEVLLIFLFTLAVYILVERFKSWQYTLKYNELGSYTTLGDMIGEKIDISKIYKYSNGDNFISTIVISPIYEELFYRYYLNIFFESKVGKLYGIVWSSFLFAFIHGLGSPLFWSCLVDGVISCILFYYSKNILISICLHISKNILSTIIILVSVKFPIIKMFFDKNVLKVTTIEFPILVTIVLVGVGALAGLLFFKTYTKKELLIWKLKIIILLIMYQKNFQNKKCLKILKPRFQKEIL